MLFFSWANMNYNVKWQIKFWFAETYISVLVKLRMVAFYLIYFLNIIWTEWNALMKEMSKNLLIQALSLIPSLFQRVMNFVCWPQICLSKVGIFPVFKQNLLFSLAFCPFFVSWLMLLIPNRIFRIGHSHWWKLTF